MKEVKALLEDRNREVENHLKFAQALIESKANRIAYVPQGDQGKAIISNYEISRSLIRTISATGYLLIYNLLESTMTAALDAVHTHLKDEKITFEQLSENLQKICIKNFKEAISKDALEEFQSIAINSVLVSFGYNPKKLWNGNVDVKKIKEKAKDYGFKIVYKGADYNDLSRNLRIVKRNRNELAHGSVSFEQCGQDVAVDALIEYSAQAYSYLLVTLEALDEYLENKKYKLSAEKAS